MTMEKLSQDEVPNATWASLLLSAGPQQLLLPIGSEEGGGKLEDELALTIQEAYSVLNLEPGASRHDVKRAYRTLAPKHFPDPNERKKPSEEMRRRMEAYVLLMREGHEK